MENQKQQDEIEIDLLELFYVLLGHVWLIISVGLFCALSCFAISRFIIPPTYKSTTKIYILNKNENTSVTYSDVQMGTQLTKDYAELINSRYVLEAVIQELSLVIDYYAVTDYEGNVGKASRVFDAANETMGDAVLDIGTAGITGELEATPLPTTSPLPSPLPSSTPTQAPMPTPNREEEQLRQQQEEQQLRQQQEEEEHRRAEEIRREQEAAKAGNPQIILKSTTINTIAGQTPAWVEVIANFQDDKDGYEALFRNLKASKYDVNERGDHAVSLTTTDSDGNVSEPVTITVHVK